jgi:hypothetical protein
MTLVALALLIVWSFVVLRRGSRPARGLTMGLIVISLVFACDPLWNAFGAATAYGIVGIFGFFEWAIAGETDVFDLTMALVYGQFLLLLVMWGMLVALLVSLGVVLSRSMTASSEKPKRKDKTP